MLVLGNGVIGGFTRNSEVDSDVKIIPVYYTSTITWGLILVLLASLHSNRYLHCSKEYLLQIGASQTNTLTGSCNSHSQSGI